jgi:hypothetical protein
MDPFFILDTPKSFGEANAALHEAVVGKGFGVLAVHDLGQTLRSKGLPFPEQCRIFEVCNPQQAAAVPLPQWRSTWPCPAGSPSTPKPAQPASA